jgi:hypothetical protein
MKTQNTILKAINYLDIYAKRSANFNDFKYIGVSQADPLKVSYIKQEKIQSLKEYTNVNIKGTAEQRKKYFTRTSINKLLSKMFIDSETKILNISQDIDKQLRKDFILNDNLFIENDLKRFYSQELENYIFVPVGSCMDKKQKEYFEIYENFINVKTQIVGLKVGKVVIARAILWTKTDKETNAKKYYLDRIYISKDFENSHKSYLQTRLYNKIKRALKLNVLDCYSFSHIKEYTKSNILNPSNTKGNEIAINQLLKNKQYPSFKVQINQDTFHELEFYPYLDTFRWGEELTENYSFDMDEDNADIILDSTAGDYTEGGGSICDCCGERFHEDDLNYSEVEDEYLCENCSTYIEERGEVVREENAVRNNYTGEYHYNNDLDY